MRAPFLAGVLVLAGCASSAPVRYDVPVYGYQRPVSRVVGDEVCFDLVRGRTADAEAFRTAWASCGLARVQP